MADQQPNPPGPHGSGPAGAGPTDAEVARSQLQQLQAVFVGRLPARLVDIRAALDRLSRDSSDTAALETLHRLVHSLTGSAGTFGLPELSDAARRLEARLAPAVQAGLPVGPETLKTLGEGVEQLAVWALKPPSAAPGASLSDGTPPTPQPGAQVHLVVHDPSQREVLCVALQAHGYPVQRHASLESLSQRLASQPARAGDAVVLDVPFAEDDPAGARWLQALQLGRHGRTPVVMAVADDALSVRLAASRAGANHTLLSPMEPARLMQMLEVLTGRQPPQPYRVLLVDDDPLLLDAQANVLKAAGMDVRSLCQPLHTLDMLEAFAPDVLLLDVYMPEVSGPELAAALRERDAHVHLPILFLSAETDLKQQLLALNLGGDDFLVKPVQPDHLVAAVTARARRARQAGALRERLQTTLYEREREHSAIDHHAIVCIADREGRITYANDLFCQVSRYQRRELLGKSHRLLLSGAPSSPNFQSMWQDTAAGKVWRGEMCCRRQDGGHYWAETTVTPFLDHAGVIYQYVAIQTDISHIKATEAALRAQRDMQRVISGAAAALMAAPGSQTAAAIEAALRDSGLQMRADHAHLFRFSKGGSSMTNSHTWTADGVDSSLDRWERLPTQITPWMKEQFLRQGCVIVQDVDTLPPHAQADRQWLQKRGLRSLVVFPLLNDNQPLGFLVYSVLREGSHRTQGEWTTEEVELLRVLADVIASAWARNIAESKRRKSEAQLNFLVSSSPVAIYTREASPPWALGYVSPNIDRLVGVDAGVLAGDAHQGLSLVHPDDRERVLQALPAVLHEGADLCEYRLRRRDGSYLWVQDQRRLVRDSAGAPLEIIGCWMDITERKQFENELSAFNHELERRVEQQTQAAVQSARFAQATLNALSARVVILDSQGRVLAANRAWEVFGAQDLVREGSSYVDVCDSACDWKPGAGQPLADGIRAVIRGEANEFLYEYICRRGDTPRWFLCRVERFPADGEQRAVVSHENITEMKLAERQQLRSQRLESLGTLAGGVAHDLNNALAPVLMGMSILKEQYPEESKLFNMIEASAQRGTHMVRQLLTFAKGAEGERVAVCPGQVVQELARLMKGSFPKNIQLQIQSDQDLPSVVGDPTQLHQVLLNLCVNARDAMPTGGLLSVGVQVVALDEVYARSIPDAMPGRYVALRVSDTGAGIPPGILDRIFDPFFTTKSADKGTGLGLSTVLGIVKGHGGFVQVYSQPGEGTTFTVYLPAAAAQADPAAPAPVVETVATRQGQGQTILFVDDEAAVRDIGRAVLERLNYQPLVATDGVDGLLKATSHSATLSAVITDLHMPLLDGLAFVRALRRSHPELPIILASGRVDEAVASEFQALGVAHRLDKPFTQEQLARTLNAALCG